MDKSIVVRRKAQQLAREGQIQRAIDEMDRVLQEGEVDPYDYVFHGDLLVRGKRLDDAISAFQEAVTAYERIGLFRNAIAVGKKILRADSSRARTYQRLGDLYAKEGLMGDAISNYLTFLDKSGDDLSGEEFLDTLQKVAEITGPKVEVALRIADLCCRAGKEDRAAMILHQVARQAEEGGADEIAVTLRSRATEICPDLEIPGMEMGDNGGSETAVEEPVDEAVNATVELVAEEEVIEEAPETESVDEPVTFETTREEHTEPTLAVTSLRDEICAAAVPDAEESPAEEPLTEEPVTAEGPVEAPSETTPEPVMESSGLAEAPQDPIEEALAEERWAEAVQLCLERIEDAPDDQDTVEKLIYAARNGKDTLALVRGLNLLGDLKITEEDFEGALDCYLRVVECDPANEIARRRLDRFREMNIPGSEQIPPGDPGTIREVIEGGDALVSVQDSEGVGSEEWSDLTSLLQEFHEGVKSQIDVNDHAGHYDLGLSHKEMGLLEEALEEFDQVLLCDNLPPTVEMKTREMRGNCLLELERAREAIHEYRAALEVPDRPEPERGEVRYQLACAFEAAGEIEEAEELFESLAGDPNPNERAKEHLERLRRSSC